jgi:hypothetical protein
MDDKEAIIGLVAAGKLLSSGAARVLNMTPVEFVQLLNSHGITLLRPTADELQQELEGAASRTQMMPIEK